MSELYVENRQIAVPGQVLAKGYDYLPGQGAYRKDEDIIANKVGLVSLQGRAVKLISLAGVYVPKPSDVLVCQVIDVTLSGWRLETNTAYSAMLSTRDVDFGYISRTADLTEYLNIGDWVAVILNKVTSQFLIDAGMVGSGLRKLPPGRIMRVNAMKVPRIIGKQGSMVSMIKETTGCQLVVGQNGRIWFRGQPQAEIVCEKAIRMISDLAHTPGLTERMKAFLADACKDIDTETDFEPMDEPPTRRDFSGGQGRRGPRDRDRDRGDRGDRRGGYNGGGYGGRGGAQRRSFNGGGHGGGRRRSFNGRGADRGDRGGDQGGRRNFDR